MSCYAAITPDYGSCYKIMLMQGMKMGWTIIFFRHDEKQNAYMCSNFCEMVKTFWWTNPPTIFELYTFFPELFGIQYWICGL